MVKLIFHNEIHELRDAFDRMRRALIQRTNELKRIQDVLEETRIRDRAIIGGLSDALVVLDQAGRITIMNKEGEVLAGAPTSVIMWQPFRHMFPRFYTPKREVVPYEGWVNMQAVRDRKPAVSRGFLERNDGKLFAVRMSAAPMFREEEFVGVVMSFHDITEELQAEESLKEFVSVASHQLRAPLASIRWFLELVMGGDAGKVNRKQWEYLYQSYSAAERMTNMINLLLSVSRIETGRLEVHPLPEDVSRLIEQAIETMRVFSERQKQALSFAPAKSPPPLLPVDRTLFSIVLENLIGNAVKYTPPGGKIEVSLSHNPQEFLVAVKDNGVGIPPEAKRHIFSKFFRAENVILLVAEGSGLGLYIVRSIVEAWGGKVWFQSEENKGSTFYFTVPASGMKRHEGDVLRNHLSASLL